MGLLQGTPCVVGGADGPLAHLGSAGINTDLLSLTIGTSAALRRWTPEPANTPGRESWCYYLSEGNWVIGGVVHDAGNVMQWLRDIIGPADENTFFSLVEEAASVPPGAEGLCFLPYFSGERSPRYNPFARAALTGMGFAHTRVHLIRALMEGIAFRVEEVYSMIDPERTARLVVSGGIRNSPAWLRVTADFLGRELHFPVSRESTAWGAALMAMRSLGTLPDLAAAGDLVETEGGVDFNPAVHARYGAVRSLYHEQYKRLFD
jgi:gluconokinase